MTNAMGLATSPDGVALPKGGSISAVAAAGSLTLLIHNREDLAPRVQVPLDDTIAPDSGLTLEIVGEVEPGIVILEDTYSSLPGGLSFCKSGKEQFLRVLHLENPAKELLRVKVTSCIKTIDLDDPGVTWSAARRTLEIRWLSGDQANYRITLTGEVQKQTGPA
jgi:hypothetical protein